jgi:hypothetical protein
MNQKQLERLRAPAGKDCNASRLTSRVSQLVVNHVEKGTASCDECFLGQYTELTYYLIEI